MSVTVCAILKVNENEAEALAKYLEITAPLLEKAQAKVLQRFTTTTTVIGQDAPQIVMLVQYPSHEAIEELFSSAGYERAKPFRDRAFATYNVNIVAQDDEVNAPALSLSE